MDFSDTLREIMKNRGWTARAIHERTGGLNGGIHYNTISNWLNRKVRGGPRSDQLDKLLKILNPQEQEAIKNSLRQEADRPEEPAAFDPDWEMRAAEDYEHSKAEAIDFALDVHNALKKAGIKMSANERFVHGSQSIRVDFISPQRKNKVVLFLKHNVSRAWDRDLGRAILIKSLTKPDSMFIVVPYLNEQTEEQRQIFEAQDIRIIGMHEMIGELKRNGL